jgi:hypothetical protein
LQEPNAPADIAIVICFFRRNDADLRLETHHDAAANRYYITVREPARETVEIFTTLTAFQARLSVLEDQLTALQWLPLGPPAPLKGDRKL